MVHQKVITVGRGLSHPTRSLKIVCRGQERHKDRKGTLGLISGPILDLENLEIKRPEYS